MKCILSIPGRPSDAGPEQGAPMDCDDYIHQAMDELREALLSDSGFRAARVGERIHLEQAKDWIERALEVLK